MDYETKDEHFRRTFEHFQRLSPFLAEQFRRDWEYWNDDEWPAPTPHPRKPDVPTQ